MKAYPGMAQDAL